MCGWRNARSTRTDTLFPYTALLRCRQAQFLGGSEEVAAHVDGKGLERRDIKGVEAFSRICVDVGEGRQVTGQRLAGAGGSDEQRVATGSGGAQHLGLVVAGRPAAGCEPLLQDRKSTRLNSSH